MGLFLTIVLFIATAIPALAQFSTPIMVSSQPPPPAPPPVITPPPSAFTGPAGACAAGGSGTATVTPNTTCQTIDGFGAMGYNVNSTVASQLWGTSGLGYSIMREPVPYFGLSSNPCNVVQQSCVTGGNANIGYAQTVIAAAGPDLKKLWTMWHYPAVLGNTGDCPLDPNAASADATMYANFIDSLRIYFSIVPDVVSVQNEPDDTFNCSGGTVPAAQMHDLINQIGSTFKSRGITVPVMMPEVFQTTDLPSYLSPTMNDPTTAGYISFEASHQYDGDPNVQVSNPYISNGKHLWETETSQGNGFGPNNGCNGCWDPSITDGLLWQNIIDHWLAGANASGWVWWQPSGCGNPPADNECLESDDDVTISKRGYIIGNYSKFVRPGWVMISATHAPQSGVTVTAFRNPATKDYAVVAVNGNSGSVSQAFSFTGHSLASATPWITSGSLNLSQQSAVSVSGGSFTYTLPGQSVTTFVGAMSN